MYYVNGAPDPSGVMTDMLVRKYVNERGGSYSEALRHIVHEQATTRTRQYAANPEQGRSIQVLGATIASLPKQSDGSPDMNLVLETLNASETFRNLATSAAGEFLDNQAQQLLHSAKSHEGITLQDCMRVAQRDNVSVAALYNGGKVTEPAVKTIWWTLFRYASSSGVRRYSSDHISYDANGNQFRTYALDIVRR
jgi:hypothetical protein